MSVTRVNDKTGEEEERVTSCFVLGWNNPQTLFIEHAKILCECHVTCACGIVQHVQLSKSVWYSCSKLSCRVKWLHQAVHSLQAHLLWADYTTAFALLEDFKEFLLLCYPSLEVKLIKVRDDKGDSKWVIVCCANYSRVEGRSVKPACLVFDGTYCFEVLLKKIKVGSWRESLPHHREICDYLDTFLENSGYLICLSIVNFKTKFDETVRFEPKHLRVWSHPISRYDSEECSLRLKPSNERLPGMSPRATCSNCRLLYRSLSTIKKRTLKASPFHKEKWTEPSSNRPLKYLSPASQVKRTTKSSEQRRYVCFSLSYHVDVHVRDKKSVVLWLISAHLHEYALEGTENSTAGR